jgi:indolepyruvate ferredoxin oxidoreductase beta subunit
VAFDALAIARDRGTEVNAVLLGALAGSGVLPVTPSAFRKAIESRGVAVAANVAGFEVGLAMAEAGGAPVTAPVAAQPWAPVPSAFAGDIAALPAEIRDVVALAIPRLVDYQDDAYARRYLERLRPFLGRPRVAALVARQLALWMTYEDAIRVAQAKTRASRFARIRAETRAGQGEVEVTDYLKPDLDEIYGILPARLVGPFARWAERRWPHGRPTVGQHVRTTTVTGFLRVWLLTWLKPLRPVSFRAHEEHARMERWLAAVTDGARRDERLAAALAALAQLVKGYGGVRRRLVGVFDATLDITARAANADPALGTAAATRVRALVLEGPDGEARAEALLTGLDARLHAADVVGARALLKD